MRTHDVFQKRFDPGLLQLSQEKSDRRQQTLGFLN